MSGGTGTSVVRTNLSTNPRGVFSFSYYSAAGSQTITANVAITGHPEGLTTANRVTYNSTSNPGVQFFNGTIGTQYTFSAWVYIETLQETPGNIGWAEAGVIAGTTGTNTVGTWQKISWTRTVTSANGVGVRVASASGATTGSFLITGIMIEAAPVGAPAFFDGATAASGDLTYAWTGTANASTSTQRISTISGYNSSAGATIGKSTDWASSGTNSVRIIPTSSSQDTYAEVAGVTLATGKTYTITAVCRLSAAQTTALETRARKIHIIHSSSAGTTFAQSNQAANAAGVTTVSVTLTVTDDTQYQSIRLYNGAAAGAGEVYWDNLLIEETDVTKPYFDGGSTASTDMNHAWSGTANASSSLMRANLPSGMSNSGGRFGYQSTEWSARGTKSVKIVHGLAATSTNSDQFIEFQGMVAGGNLLANTTYTISGTCRTTQALTGTLDSRALKFYVSVGGQVLTITYTKTKPNAAGASRVVGSFTTSAATSISFLRAYNGSVYGAGDVWWDELCLEVGLTDGSYFDGTSSANDNMLSNPSFETNTTGWGGAGQTPATISRITSQSHSGSACLQIVADGSISFQGAFTSSNRPVIKPHMTYTAVAWVKADAGKSISIEIGELDASSVLIGRTQPGPVVATGSWQRLTATRSMGANAAFGDVVIRNYNAVAHTFYVDSVMYIQTDTAPYDYYAGTGDFTYAWTGTADQSSSNQRAVTLGGWGSSTSGGVYQSSIFPVNGSKCGAVQTRGTTGDGIYHNNVNVTAGMSYTFSSWIKITSTLPQLSGVLRWKDASDATITDTIVNIYSSLVVGSWVRVSVTAVAPALTTTVQPMWRIYAAHTPTTFYVDSAMLEQSPVPTTYLDGTSTATGDFTYSWSGTANQSASTEVAVAVPAVQAGKSFTSAYVDSKHYVYSSTAEDGKKTLKFVAPMGTPSSSWRFAAILGSSAAGFTPTIKAGGQYTLWFRYRATGWSGSHTFQVQVSDTTGLNVVAASDTPRSINTTTWQEYRRTFTAAIDATSSTSIYISLPLTPLTTSDGVFEIREWMLVEGEYTGDYVDGTRPLSKWHGTAHQSVSSGYPPRLTDLAGKPDVVVTSGTTILPGSWSNTEGRTMYTVYANLLDITDSSVPSLLTYGATALSDAIPNQFITLRQQAWTGNVNFLLARRTGGSGSGVSGAPIGINVAAWGMNSAGTLFNSINNGTTVVDGTFVMDVPHEKIAITAPTAYGSHIITLIYRGYHDPTTRAAVTRYLGNKYGAVVL
jgi:hypothetical protein